MLLPADVMDEMERNSISSMAPASILLVIIYNYTNDARIHGRQVSNNNDVSTIVYLQRTDISPVNQL